MPTPVELLNGGFVAGALVVWWLIVRKWWRGKPLLEAVGDETPRYNVAAVLVAALWVGSQLYQRVLQELSPDSGAFPSVPDLYDVKMGIFINAVVLAFLCLLLSDLGDRRFREFGIRLDRWRRDLRDGSLGYLAALPLVLAVYAMTSPLRGAGYREHAYMRLLQGEGGWGPTLWIAVAVIVAAPLVEELLYRVILQGALRSKLPAAAAIGISSVLFAGVHGFPDSLALVPLGIVLGYVFEKRRSWLAVVVLHALFNAGNLAAKLLTNPL
ncbi:MAG: lysostaphin resistance A-like protein [Planctomycetaceae bacterium]